MPDDPTEPAFTAQEAADFVLTHPMGARRFHADGPFTVESVEFLPAREVHARLNTITGAPDETLLCLVELRGAFTFHGMRGMAPAPYIGKVLRVFDARTGDLVLQETELKPGAR